MTNKDYVIISPVKNEETHIEKTIKSIISQTLLPKKWIIVNDGSTDKTQEIIEKYSAKYEYIEIVNNTDLENRNFGSKVKAFRKGFDTLKNESYSFIGNLDGDVSFEPDYYQSVLSEFDKDTKLGLAGGIIMELIGEKFLEQNISHNSVAGAIQLFRNECFREIGGYIELPYGGIDAAAEIMTRMNGWRVKTLSEYKVYHHRRAATGKKSIIRARVRQGIIYYLLGYHPVFYFLASIRRITNKPYLIGSVARIFGYIWAFIRRMERPIPPDVTNYLRKEQNQRLRSVIQ
jgi:glycosyltransferase involved in cell wall biosynthesis